MVTVGFFLVLLIQRECGWAGLGVSSRWFHRLRMLVVTGLWSLADALPRCRLSRLGLAGSSALRA